MSDCNERNYELIGQITVCSDEDATFTQPFSQMRKCIGTNEYLFSATAQKHIPLKAGTATLKEARTLTANGEQYEVTVECRVEEVTAETVALLDVLKWGTFHLKIRTFANRDMVVRSAPGAYGFAYREEGGEYLLTWTIQNHCGASRVM